MKFSGGNSNYFGLWMLLAVSLLAIVAYSFSEDLHFGDYTMKKAPIAERLLAKEVEKTDSDINIGVEEIKMPVKKVVELDTMPKSILLFGDSMTLNLALRLSRYAKENGHDFHAINWDSSNTKIWAESDTLEYFMKEYKPDFIFISLGSNEVYFKKPETRMPYVKKILAKIGDIPYVWIGPPNWNEDTGINDMLEKVCTPGSFFRSQGMDFKRKADKIHPTRQSSALWIDSIMRWMPKSSHPILAHVPSDSLGKVKTNVVFLKALNK